MKNKKLPYKDFDLSFDFLDWKVKMIDKEDIIRKPSGRIHGYCDYDAREIIICYKNKNPFQVRTLLFHELTHMFLYLFELSDGDENNVCRYDAELTAELIGKGMAQITFQLPKWVWDF